jgi:hypothetical protein
MLQDSRSVDPTTPPRTRPSSHARRAVLGCRCRASVSRPQPRADEPLSYSGLRTITELQPRPNPREAPPRAPTRRLCTETQYATRMKVINIFPSKPILIARTRAPAHPRTRIYRRRDITGYLHCRRGAPICLSYGRGARPPPAGQFPPQPDHQPPEPDPARHDPFTLRRIRATPHATSRMETCIGALHVCIGPGKTGAQR